MSRVAAFTLSGVLNGPPTVRAAPQATAPVPKRELETVTLQHQRSTNCADTKYGASTQRRPGRSAASCHWHWQSSGHWQLLSPKATQGGSEDRPRPPPGTVPQAHATRPQPSRVAHGSRLRGRLTAGHGSVFSWGLWHAEAANLNTARGAAALHAGDSDRDASSSIAGLPAPGPLFAELH